MNINTQFDSGNILVVDDSNPLAIKLNIDADSNSEFKQWFHFRLNGDTAKQYRFEILNAKDCSYVEGWENYQVVASYDGDDWFRIDTTFEDGILSFQHELQHNSISFAYFTPYSYQRHQALVQSAQTMHFCEHQVLGKTVDGRDIDLLIIGDANTNKKPVWITARQHPGETMAEWCAEGLIERLLNEDDAMARSMLETSVFYIVPNMNIDGSIRGNLRSNAAGANLNREWQQPSLEKSPEVLHVRQKMFETGVAAYLDLHGDEALPYVFVAGCEGVPSFNADMAKLEQDFSQILQSVNPDFQTEFGYPKDEPGKANLTVASNWVGEQFNCLALTLEMPFKDNDNLPNADTAWSAERSYLLGETLLNPLYQLIERIG